jgi:hypothetical protein
VPNKDDAAPLIAEVPTPTVPEEDEPTRTKKANAQARNEPSYTINELVEAYGASVAGALYDIDPKRERTQFSLEEAERALEAHLSREVTR